MGVASDRREDSLLQPNGKVPHPQPQYMVQANPGKCILFGEHAVVYGQPAVAVAIDQRMSVNLQKNGDWRIDGMSFHPRKTSSHGALKQRLWQDGPPLAIKITGDIPPAGGLGSSAALSVAASAALRCTWTPNQR